MSRNFPNQKKKKTDDDALDPYKDIEFYLEKAQEEIGLAFSRRFDANDNDHLEKNKMKLDFSFNDDDDTYAKNLDYGIQSVKEGQDDRYRLDQLQSILQELTQGHRVAFANTTEVGDLEGCGGNSRLSEGVQTCRLTYHHSFPLSSKQAITSPNKSEKACNLPAFWQQQQQQQPGGAEASWQDLGLRDTVRLRDSINAKGVQVTTAHSSGHNSFEGVGHSCGITQHTPKTRNFCWRNSGYSMSTGRRHAVNQAASKSEMQNYSTFRSDLILANSKLASSTGNVDIHVLSNWANKLADEMNSFATQHALEKSDGDEHFRLRNEHRFSSSWSDFNRHDDMFDDCTSSFVRGTVPRRDAAKIQKTWNKKPLPDDKENDLQFCMDEYEDDVFVVGEFTKQMSAPADAGPTASKHKVPHQKKFSSEIHRYVSSGDKDDVSLGDQLRFVQEMALDIDGKSTPDVSKFEDRVVLPEKHQESVVTYNTCQGTVLPGRDSHLTVNDGNSGLPSMQTVESNGVSSEKMAVGMGTAVGAEDAYNVVPDNSVKRDMRVTSDTTMLEGTKSDKSLNLCKVDSPRARLGSSPSFPLDPDDVRAFIRRVETSILESSEGSAADLGSSSSGNVPVIATTCAKDFRNTSTQTSPLVSRSSSFVWISDMDLQDRSFPQQFDAITGSVNSLLSSCSSLETFSEDSQSKLSSDDSDLTDPYDDCTEQNLNYLMIREETENNNLDSQGNYNRGKIKFVIRHVESDMVKRNSKEQDDDDMCTTAAQVTSDSEGFLDTENDDNANNKNECLISGKSLSEISTAKSSVSTLSSSSLVGSSSSVQSVRDVHMDSNVSGSTDTKASTPRESKAASKSEPRKSSHTTVTKTTSLTPPPKLKPLVLRTTSATSAPSSVVSTPLVEVSPASADIGHEHTMVRLSIFDCASKSSSAPILDSRTPGDVGNGLAASMPSPSSRDINNINMKVIPPLRSQSVKELAELEAVEACEWLRAAGFPQYAQMFEDMQFPINIAAVQKDHYFLDQDAIQSLFRRLNALNRCAKMRLDSIPRKTNEDSDEEEQCALSENWTFQRQSRRWSRISTALETSGATLSRKSESHPSKTVNGKYTELTVSSGKDCKMLGPISNELEVPESPIPMDEDGSGGSASIGSLSTSEKMDDSTSSENRSFRRTNSERLRDGAKAFLRRMESLKTRRSKRQNREVVVISGPQVLDLNEMQSRVQKLACVDITPPNSAASSPQMMHHCHNSDSRGVTSEDNSSTNSTSDTSQTSTPTTHVRNGHWAGSHVSNSSEHGAFSDSECSPTLWRAHRDANSNDTKFIDNYIPASADLSSEKSFARNCNQVNGRTGSFNLGNDSLTFKERFIERRKIKSHQSQRSSDKRKGICDVSFKFVGDNSHYHSKDQHKKCDNQSNNKRTAYLQDSDSCSSVSTNHDAESENLKAEIHLDESPTIRTKSNHHHHANSNWSIKRPHPVIVFGKHAGNSINIDKLSAAQIMLLRKLSLLKLTALIERHSPSNRSGWSWIMPKFMKRMKTPDYKDKVIFGVPLSVIYQQTGQPLPPSIQAAMSYLQENSEEVGLFRKSGVRSRIQKLKNMNESNPSMLSYEGQQSYDVADMLKQYFRELPEALFTNKMSETFICIYQHIPECLRHEAVQAAIMLMPDENRETLHILLKFLHDLAQQSNINQMTASNLAVCFAPSLFHMASARSASSSPRRRKTVGVPDAKELNENKAAHECLTYMIVEHKKLFAIPEEIINQCRLSISNVDCVPLEALGRANGSLAGNWHSYVNSAIDEMLKESKDKFKGWVSVTTSENADIAYRKVGDSNPLRQWKVSVEVEAPPIELLTRVLRERHLWDSQLMQWNVVTRLNNHSEIFYYISKSQSPIASRDYCVLRSWRSDLPKGSCVLVETSVDHPENPIAEGDVRGYILLSRYLIEPCGSGKSRITHVSRIDTKGRSPEWYSKIYSHNCALHLIRIGESFRLSTEGPESKV